jgi:hypothetical protein
MLLAFFEMNDDFLHKIISLGLIYHPILIWVQHGNTSLRARMTEHILPQWVLIWRHLSLLLAQILEKGGS